MPILVRPLRETDDRASFRSGDEDLDRFFHRFAGQNQFKHHIGVTYVAVDDERGEIVGFATVASCSIELAPSVPLRKRPAYPLPALRLARMAVASHRQRQGIGDELMRAVFVIARDQDRRSGCAFVVVDAKADAVAFYERFGFESAPVVAGELDVRPSPRPMFLEIGAIPDLGEPPPT